MQNLILRILIVAPSLSFAASVCEIRGEQNNLAKCISEHCSSSERARSIQFPDGREIWILGHNHGFRSNKSEFAKLIANKSSEAEFNALFDKVLNHNSPSQTDIEDAEFLKRYLSKQNSSTFVGIETSPQLVDILEGEVETIDSFMADNHPSLSNKTNMVKLKLLGPQIYLKKAQPEYFTHAQLKGFENVNLLDKEASIQSHQSQNYQNLLKKLENYPDVLKLVRQANWEFTVLSETYDPARHDQFILNAIRSDVRIPNEVRPQILEWVKWVLETLKIRRERDRISAKNMADDKRSGILIVGQLHLSSIMRFLQQECRLEMAATTSTTTGASTTGNIPLPAPTTGAK